MRQQLLEAGVKLFHQQGFCACGVQEIADTAGVPKGSFYNHFESKDAFATSIVDRYWEQGEARLQEALDDRSARPRARLEAYFRMTAERVKSRGFDRGCLLGNLSLELADRSPLIRRHLDRAFKRWTKLLATGVEAAQAAGEMDPARDPHEVAAFLISAFEGAILRARVERSMLPFERFQRFALEPLFIAPGGHRGSAAGPEG